MNEDIIKLGKYLKKEIDTLNEDIMERLDAIEAALTTEDEDDDSDYEEEDDTYSEFDDFEDDDLEDEEPVKIVKKKKPVPTKQVQEEVEDEEEFDYSDDDLESTTDLPDDVEHEIGKLAPEEKEQILKRKIKIKKPRIIKNESTETN